VGHLAAEYARPPCKLQVADCRAAEDWPKSAPRRSADALIIATKMHIKAKCFWDRRVGMWMENYLRSGPPLLFVPFPQHNVVFYNPASWTPGILPCNQLAELAL